MAKEKENKETKDEVKVTDSVSIKREKQPAKKPRIIWLYGAHTRLVSRALFRLLDFGSEASIKLRDQLKLTLGQPIVPVYPYPAASRKDVLDELKGAEGFTVVVFGLPTDLQDNGLKQYYKGTEAAWIHPPERQFYVDMAAETTAITWQEAERRLKEGVAFLGGFFDESDIRIIRA